MQKDVKVNYMILKESIVVNFEAQNFTVVKGTDDYKSVLACIKENTLQDIPGIVCKATIINQYIPDGEFAIHKGVVYSNGEEIPGYIGSQLLMFAENDLPYEYLLNFWNKVKDNPSDNSKEQLYRFLEQAKCPISQNGNFIAYKSVTSKMQAHHKKSMVYEMNVPMIMERCDVVDSPDKACGPGLHVGSYEYAQSFGGNGSLILEVEVDPGDVVSVPTDCKSGKLRACKITPINICRQEYDTTTVAEDIGHVDDVKATERAAGETFVINRMKYTYAAIDANAFEKAVSATNKKAKQLTRVTPTKMPKSIREVLDIKVGYRYMPNKNAAPVYLVCTVDEEYFEFLTEAAVKAAAKVSKKKKKVVKSVGSLEIARKPHDIVELTEKGMTAATDNGTIHVRPSKWPVAIKRQYPDAESCVRVIDKTKSVYLVRNNNTWLLLSQVVEK